MLLPVSTLLTLSNIDKSTEDLEKVKEAASTFSQYAPLYGLKSSTTVRLLKVLIASDSKLPVQVRISIVRDYLYPRHYVSSKVVMLILGLKFAPVFVDKDKSSDDPTPAPPNHVPIKVHIALLKWLIVVFPFLADSQIVTKLYSTLFCKIPYESTRLYVCHLLYLATTQAIVVPWRCQLLVEYYSKFPNSLPILGLLQVYKSYAPNIFQGTLAQIKTQKIFSNINVNMELQIRKIHETLKNNKEAQQQLRTERVLEQPNNGRKRIISSIPENESSSNKKQKTDDAVAIASKPHPSTANVPRVRTSDIQSTPTLFNPALQVENITSVNQFVNGFQNLKFPDQLGSVFSDTNGMLLRLLIYKGTSKEWDRINSWLLQQLFDCVEWAAETPGGDIIDDTYEGGYGGRTLGNLPAFVASSVDISGILNTPTSTITRVNGGPFLQFYLEKILEFYMYTKKLPEAAEEFLYEYMSVWDGIAHSKIMQSLIAVLPMRTLQITKNQILSPFRRLSESRYASRHVYIYETLAMLVRNWRLQELLQDLENQRRNVDSKGESTQQQINNITRFSDHCQILREICTFVDYYGLFSVEQFHDNIKVSLSVIAFFKEVALYPVHEYFPVVLTMGLELLYYLLMTKSGVVLSHCCDLVLDWKPLHMSDFRDQSLNKSTEFQMIVLDFCNGIWLNKAFEKSENIPENWPDMILNGTLPENDRPDPMYFLLHPKLIVKLKAMTSKQKFDLNFWSSFSLSLIFCRRTLEFWRSLEKQEDEEATIAANKNAKTPDHPKKFKSSVTNLPPKKISHRLLEPPTYPSLRANINAGGLMLLYGDFRIKLLDHLKYNGFFGLHSLLYNTMKKLMARKSETNISNTADV